MNSADENAALPEGWEARAFGSVLDAKYGKSLPARKRRGGQTPVYGSNGVVGHHDEGITNAPVIVIGRKGSVGAINYSDDAAWPIDTTYFIDDFVAFVPSFLREALRWLRLDEMDRSTAIPGLSREQLYERELVVLPLAEQRRIAARLEEIETRRAAITARLQAAAAVVENVRHAVLAAACSGRLTQDWRTANEPDGVDVGPPLSRKGAAHATASSNTDQFTEIPETWSWWTVESITDQVIDYRGRTPRVDADASIPHIRTTQIRHGHIDWNADRFITPDVYAAHMTRGLPERDDVLFTMEAPMGEVGVIDRDEPFSIAQRILLLRPRDDVSGHFLALALQSTPVRRAIEYRATGTGVSGVAYKRLRSVMIPKPPRDEQAEIVRRAATALSTADRLAAQIERAAEMLDRVSRASLAKAFRGELVPTEAALAEELGRDYESADQLLARAAAARASNAKRRRPSRRAGNEAALKA